ncbi:hypothetical protein D3C86_2082980 [compost metagenome]
MYEATIHSSGSVQPIEIKIAAQSAVISEENVALSDITVFCAAISAQNGENRLFPAV